MVHLTMDNTLCKSKCAATLNTCDSSISETRYKLTAMKNIKGTRQHICVNVMHTHKSTHLHCLAAVDGRPVHAVAVGGSQALEVAQGRRTLQAADMYHKNFKHTSENRVVADSMR
jgi:hypothetical protein